VLLRSCPFTALRKDVLVYIHYKQKSGGCPLFNVFGIELQKDSSIELIFTQGLSPTLPARRERHNLPYNSAHG
jgi:hypothetical protein